MQIFVLFVLPSFCSIVCGIVGFFHTCVRSKAIIKNRLCCHKFTNIRTKTENVTLGSVLQGKNLRQKKQ